MEFDDKHESKRLVYGIAVNKPLKRITVIFRGTYAENTRDWYRNLQFGLVQVPLPEAARDQSSTENDPLEDTSNKLFVHRGIYEYLLRNSERGTEYPRERYEEILSHILNCVDQTRRLPTLCHRAFDGWCPGLALGHFCLSRRPHFQAHHVRIDRITLVGRFGLSKIGGTIGSLGMAPKFVHYQ